MEPKEELLHAFREELGQLYYYHGSDKNWTMMNYHYHENCEIILTMSDGVTIDIGKYSYKANNGDLFLIRSKEFHRIKPIENSSYNRYVLMFDLKVLRRLVEPLGYDFLRYFEDPSDLFMPKISLSGSSLSTLREMFNRIDLLYSNQNDQHACAVLNLLIAEILFYIQELYDFFQQNGKDQKLERNVGQFEVHNNQKVRVQQIKQYICDNIEEKLTLSMIADQFYISKYYLSHYFRRETGFSIMQYITMQKTIRAKKMLKNGCSITNVAITLGYNSDSHFISTFQKYAGITPKRYVMEANRDKNQ